MNVIYKQNKINSVPAVFDILELRWHKGHSVKMYVIDQKIKAALKKNSPCKHYTKNATYEEPYKNFNKE